MILKSQLCKYIILLVVVSFCVGVCGDGVLAHPPQRVELSYEPVTSQLTVNVVHDSDDLSLHYIDRLELRKNDVEMNVSEAVLNNWEQDEQGLLASYNISVTEGDEIMVVAYCTVAGSQSNSIVISFGNNDDENSSTPGFEGVLCLVAVVFVGFLMWRRRF